MHNSGNNSLVYWTLRANLKPLTTPHFRNSHLIQIGGMPNKQNDLLFKQSTSYNISILNILYDFLPMAMNANMEVKAL